MKFIKSISDLEQLRNTSLHDTVHEIISPYIYDPAYRPEDDGYVALLEPGNAGFQNSRFSPPPAAVSPDARKISETH